ncbi:MAG: TetR/AcrR family transcriptional regulator [Oscillospiraceae bacterium]|nr:TetR/AcrR family transcriptional regulator [Oscillospiraceae bacterium]
MSPKLFSITEKEQLKEKMFLSGLELLKEYGMTHMSVEKITSAAGIGKSTFYNFFMSKEDFVIALIEYNRDRFWKEIADILGDREKLTVPECKNILMSIINDKDSVYQYLTPEDERKLAEAAPEKAAPQLDEETETLKRLFSLFDNVRSDIDYAVVSNLLKIIAMTAESKEVLHESGYHDTQEKLFGLLFGCIFKENENE